MMPVPSQKDSVANRFPYYRARYYDPQTAKVYHAPSQRLAQKANRMGRRKSPGKCAYY